MHKFRQVFEFYINSSIHVSLSVVALSVITGLALNISVDNELLAFLFFSTVTGYNFVKYAEVAGLHHRSLTKYLRDIQMFSVICGVGMVFFASKLQWETMVACLLLGSLTLLYAVPFLTRNRNLRRISGIKIYIIALVWSGVTVILPVIENGLYPYWDVRIVFLQRFFFVLALMIPFEIRDLRYDKLSLKTVPQLVGVKKAKIIGVIWLLLFYVLDFFRDEYTTFLMISHLAMLVLLGSCIALSEKRQAPYYASFWIEGIPLLWLWILLVFNSVMQL